MTGADIVYGQRRTRKGESWFKRTATLLFYRLLRRLVEIDIPLDTGDFRLINRRVLDMLNAMPEQNRFIRGMIGWIGLKQVPLVYDRDPRFAGVTGYPLRKLIRLALDGITGFSIIPCGSPPISACSRALSACASCSIPSAAGYSPRRRRLDQPDDGHPRPGQRPAHGARHRRRISRAALSRNEAPDALSHSLSHRTGHREKRRTATTAPSRGDAGRVTMPATHSLFFQRYRKSLTMAEIGRVTLVPPLPRFGAEGGGTSWANCRTGSTGPSISISSCGSITAKSRSRNSSPISRRSRAATFHDLPGHPPPGGAIALITGPPRDDARCSFGSPHAIPRRPARPDVVLLLRPLPAVGFGTSSALYRPAEPARNTALRLAFRRYACGALLCPVPPRRYRHP